MREKILIIIYLLFLMSNSIYAQDNKKEELYLDILEFVLSEQVFDINEMMFVYENDTSFFYCRYENFVESSEKRYEFTYNENKIKVWPGDHVFFYDIKNYVKIDEFNYLNDNVTVILETYIDQKAIKRFNLNLIKKGEKWKIKKIKSYDF